MFYWKKPSTGKIAKLTTICFNWWNKPPDMFHHESWCFCDSNRSERNHTKTDWPWPSIGVWPDASTGVSKDSFICQALGQSMSKNLAFVWWMKHKAMIKKFFFLQEAGEGASWPAWRQLSSPIGEMSNWENEWKWMKMSQELQPSNTLEIHWLCMVMCWCVLIC